MQVRRHVHYSGQVQGVGFRYRAERLAGGSAVVGVVRNLRDGRVELVVEGEGEAVAEFLAAVRKRMGGYIAGVEEQDEPPTGEFSTFEIAYDWG